MNHRVFKSPLPLTKLLRWGIFILLTHALFGCSSWPYGAPHTNSQALRPQRTLHELLAHRVVLCSQEKSQRAEQMRLLRNQLQLHTRKDAASDIDEGLDGLMLTSCEPASSPGLMGEVLNQLVNLGEWPAEYDHLFDLLRSEQRAISQYNARNLDSARENTELRQALQAQKEELNKLQSSYKEAIKGIGEIEETLDSRKQKRLPIP
ncbi:MAG TPA: hypothetical protein VIZ65_06110 [Cellvibrionaceae bacterium]